MPYSKITDAEIEPGKPGSNALFTKLRDNPEASVLSVAVFLVNGNFICPRTGEYLFTLIPGGGGGGGNSDPGAQGGFIGKGLTEVISLTQGDSYPVVVGLAGQGVAQGLPGGAGGASSFEGFVAPGGAGGAITGAGNVNGEDFLGYGIGGIGGQSVPVGAIGFGAGGGNVESGIASGWGRPGIVEIRLLGSVV